MNKKENIYKPSVLPPANGQPYRGIRRWSIGLFLGIAGFLLTSQVILLLAPKHLKSLKIQLADQKLMSIEKADLNYQIVFLGSSRILRAIDPAELDTALEKHGCRINTFNFGVQGLSLLEQSHIIDKLATKKPEINTIVIEPYSVPDRKLRQFISARRRYFYDWENIASVYTDHFTMPNVTGTERCVKDTLSITYGFLYEQFGVGRMSAMLFPKILPDKKNSPPPTSNGFMPKDGQLGNPNISIKLNFLEKLNNFEKSQQKAAADETIQQKIDARYQLVVRLVNKIRQLNIKPVVLIMPHVEFYDAAILKTKLVNSGKEPISVLNFNQPAEYPELFHAENWRDLAHLNSRGSKVISKLLASKLCSIQRQE